MIHSESDDQKVEKLSAEIENLLQTVGKAKKPWFLSCSQIFNFVKDSFTSLSINKAIFDKSLVVIVLITNYINQNTKLNVVLDADSINDTILKLEDILTMALLGVDDGVDVLRVKFITHVRKLLLALVNHKHWMESLVKEKNAQLTENTNKAKSYLRTRFEQFSEILIELLNVVKKRYPQSFEKVACFTSSTTGFIQQTTTNVLSLPAQLEKTAEKTSFCVLQKAQPYVHIVVRQSKPFVKKATDLVEPYLPFTKPYVDFALEKQKKLQENKYFGFFVTKVVDKTVQVYDFVKDYVNLKEEGVEEEEEQKNESD
jgi:hypothetical protein